MQPPPEAIEAAMGRQERPVSIDEALTILEGNRILVTGSEGSLGAPLCALLVEAGIEFIGFDLKETPMSMRCDVTDLSEMQGLVTSYDPHLVFHLAGAKHAPDGEFDPWEVCRVNAVGTACVIEACRMTTRARIVTASTCKACDPETAYGASKLIAERMTLNADGWVARFYNVVNTNGNVFGKWLSRSPDEPLAYTAAERYFMSAREAISFLVNVPILPPGRYSFDPGKPREMHDVAREFAHAMGWHSEGFVHVPLRRGDRREEPLKAASEHLSPSGIAGIWRVDGRHDPEQR